MRRSVELGYASERTGAIWPVPVYQEAGIKRKGVRDPEALHDGERSTIDKTE
jgi:hypothetical protein